jgi:DNA-binding transcriptional LysR family regulator
VEVAETRSFTKAAGRLGVTTGSLSQTIRALEESLGVRLLNRTTRSVALTEAGERILTRLRPLLDDFEVVVDSANAFRDRPAGQLPLHSTARGRTLPAPSPSLSPLCRQRSERAELMPIAGLIPICVTKRSNQWRPTRVESPAVTLFD